MMNAPVAIKENGQAQRSDVALTQEIVGALVQKVLEEGKIYDGQGTKGTIALLIGDDQTPISLSKNTLKDWIVRRNVVPGIGKPLRDILDAAREEYRANKRNEIIEHKLNRAISMRTREPVIGMFGPIVDKQSGKPMMRENPKLFAEQMKNVRWLAEKLIPKYAKVERQDHRHLVFSLADLRRAKEARDAQRAQQQ